MALISLRQLLDHAAENGYGLPAFNVNNMEQVKAIMEAAAAVDSPVILQGSAGARSYAGEPFLRHLIQAAIEKLMKGRTAIVIAHRLSTIRDADNIIVLNHGKLSEQGSHAELMVLDQGIYQKLYLLQALEE